MPPLGRRATTTLLQARRACPWASSLIAYVADPPPTRPVSFRLGEDRESVLLGQAVREARKAQGLTQKQVAERSGVHVTYISDIERGARNPSWKAIASLAAGMGVSTADIARRYDALVVGQPGGTGRRDHQ